MRLTTLFGAVACVFQVQALSEFLPVRAPSVPLAVRSPYLNTWLNGPKGESKGYLAGQWAQFWTGAALGWQGFVKVDGENFNWMGAHPGVPLVDQVSLEYTSTKTIFTMRVGTKIEMRIEFLTPVFPDDIKRQSMTSSYLEVAVKSIDGKAHDVQLYADVSGQWASGDPSAGLEWANGTQDGVIYHKFWRAQQRVFEETVEQASWGNWYWATTDTANEGALANTMDRNFRPIERDWPVFGLAHNLGPVSDGWERSLFTIGYTQEVATQFVGASKQAQNLTSYWRQYYSEQSLVSVFFHDWAHAQEASTRLDRKVADDSTAAAGRDYLTLTSLTVRQTFGALAFTGSGDDVMVWQKEISSGSFIQTVDVIFPTWPFMLYFNPNLIRWSLSSLVENQEAGNYPNDSAMHDLGRYPNALGYPDGNDWPMPLEESANMVIMMLSYAQKMGDTAYLRQHQRILEKWGQHLVDNSRVPVNQMTTDDFAGSAANQTNLALKGIIALRAMGEVENLLAARNQQQTYTTVAGEYLDFWIANAMNANASTPRAMLQYNVPNSYNLLYNLYADRALRLRFVPESVYDAQSKFYPTVLGEYGIVLDTRNDWTKLDWEMFSAAVASRETCAMVVETIARWIGQSPTDRALTDLYDVRTGDFPSARLFTARPVVGGAFSILAL
ncbi:protein of unknown function (DUF1793) [Geosmithia morbida]|uniref:Glutaminase GtaA n=1 Tax=Geosmithia morbida TaxID=1094350 RepID=A0A9P5D1P3_9HYPO|nr:protein of unknown function (DUF1793) [Geosmithia morbida]KAF4120020.1 protein of unknown function (DUF1793) [Geosmithia morbida]